MVPSRERKMFRFAKLMFIIGLLAANCTFLLAQEPAQREPSSVENRLANTQWRLVSYGVSGSESPVVQGTNITLKFGVEGRAGGSGGCNSYGAEYLVRGDNVSFSKIFSTKRACLEQSANQQEQLYLAALESAKRFKLSNNSLTIFYADGQSALNFVKDSSSSPATARSEGQCSPVTVLTSFYNAVNAKEYERAYRYWETPPGSLDDFARGYVNTASVQLIVEPPMHISGAAGSLYADIPTMLVARQQDGGEQVFVGCYVTRKSNLHPADIPKEEVWRIYKASMSPVPANIPIPKLLARACRN
jgi:heat shock protein HslJ